VVCHPKRQRVGSIDSSIAGSHFSRVTAENNRLLGKRKKDIYGKHGPGFIDKGKTLNADHLPNGNYRG
jgi:hypothetical protein